MGALRHLGGRPVAGPHMNAYHGGTLDWLASRGAVRFVAPLEMDSATLALLAEKPAALECEVMVWGRMALAFSARCFTARHFRLKKDDCGFRCIEHPDGLDLRTRESRDFLAINGIQVQSAACLDLLDQAMELAVMGARVLRVSPQSTGTQAAIAALDATRHGAPAAEVAPPAGMERCNGYYGHAGIDLLRGRHEPEPARAARAAGPAAASCRRRSCRCISPPGWSWRVASNGWRRRPSWMAGASPSPSRTWACAAASPCAAARSARVGRRAGRAGTGRQAGRLPGADARGHGRRHLFFQRRLRISGDTELGLIVKNWLDASPRPAWLDKLGALGGRKPEAGMGGWHDRWRRGA